MWWLVLALLPPPVIDSKTLPAKDVEFPRLRPPLDGIERTRDGWRYRDRVHNFVADIDEEGRVHFHDTRTTVVRLRESDSTFARLRAAAGLPVLLLPSPPIVGVRLKFATLSDVLTKQSIAKNGFLQSTAQWRDQLRSIAKRRRVDRAIDAIRLELMEIWYDKTYSLTVRKAQLFERWDECHEANTLKPSEEQIAGERARRVIEAFIRRHARRGTAQAFSDAELRQFNTYRRSTQRFSPYHPQTEDPQPRTTHPSSAQDQP